jgi:plasmid stability protein
MANLTLAIDEDLLRRARVRAAEQGTSVNSVVRQLIEGYSSSDRAGNARKRLVALSITSVASS